MLNLQKKTYLAKEKEFIAFQYRLLSTINYNFHNQNEKFQQPTNMSYFILQEDGNFSFLETQDDKHLIPQSWKDNSYATVRNSISHCDQNVHKETIVPDSANSIREDVNRKKNIPDATSTPKRNLTLLEHTSKYISLSSRARKNFLAKDNIDIEERPLIDSSIDYQR